MSVGGIVVCVLEPFAYGASSTEASEMYGGRQDARLQPKYIQKGQHAGFGGKHLMASTTGCMQQH
jgi:hypothetical protein